MREDLVKAEADKAQLQTHSLSLESEWQAAKARIEELAAELASAQETQRRQSEALQAMREDLVKAEADKAQLQAHSQSLESEWQAAKAKVEELNNHARHWFTVATEREKQLAAVYASKSWKLTAPLRLGYQLILGSFNQTVLAARSALSALRRLLSLPFRLLGRLLLWLLPFLMRQVLHRPLLAKRLNRKIMRLPWLYRPLRALAIRRGLMTVQAQPLSSGASDNKCDQIHTTESMTDLSQLSPRARQIYLDLKTAVERHHRVAN